MNFADLYKCVSKKGNSKDFETRTRLMFKEQEEE